MPSGGIWIGLRDDVVYLRKFSKAKCNVLPLVQSNPRHTWRLSEQVIESSPVEKDGGRWLMKNST